MSATPTRGRRALDDDELLALARAVPEPPLTDERREEMRTAFLATARGLRSGAQVQVIAVKRRRRLLLLGMMIAVACAGAAAAAWRVRRRSSRYPSPLRPAAAVERAPLASSPAPAPLSEQPPPAPARPTHPVPAAHPRRIALSSHQAREDVDGGNAVEVAFARGWSSLRTGDFNTAADWFARAAAGQPNALGEDAMFWQGVALDRAGRFDVAHRVLGEFLTRYPDSDRKGEASVMLGWLFVRSGDFGAARDCFEGALDDAAERVRKSAHSGLIATGRHLRGAATANPRLP